MGEDSSATAAGFRTVWPESLSRIGAIRFARRYHNYEEAVHFYRDLVGLPLLEIFHGSYGTNGTIFGLPDSSLTFELVESNQPVAIDPHEQLCLYFPDAEAKKAAHRRLGEAGIEPVESHPYWAATGATTYRDPDGRGLVFAPFVYGTNEQ
jgi:catechol 2,3-dioxygenase-like lactoylglutathione lyase family enzyme